MKKSNKKIHDESPKWPLRKFINKFFIFNVFLTVGLVMLILSIVCMNKFDIAAAIGNIVASSLVTAAGLAGGLVYSLLFTKKCEKVYEEEWAWRTKTFFWVPILGIVFDKIFKSKEKAYNLKLRLKENPNYKKPKMVLPNSISLIFAAMIGVVFLIWILYICKVVTPDLNKGQHIPGILDIFLNPLRGFAGYTTNEVIGSTPDGKAIFKTVNGVGSIVIFLLLFNGTMTLVNDAHAIEAGVGSLLRKMKGKEIVLIPVLMFILAICGSTFNMCEQLLPLYLVIIPIMFAAGFDVMTGFLMVNMSAGVGVMASTVNPVLLGTAVSSIPDEVRAQLPAGFNLMTGIVWRLVMFVVLVTITIVCTILYARKVRKDPMRSCVYLSDKQFKDKYTFDKDALPPMTQKRKWTLIVFGIAFLMLIVGFVDWQQIANFNGFSFVTEQLAKYFPFISSITPIGSWGMVEAGMLFFIASMIIGAINWKGASHFFSTFYSGCKDFVGVAFIVAVAKGLSITLSDSGFNQVIANGLGSALGKMPALGAAIIIFIVIALLTVFIPSSSGLASAMFPMISSSVVAAGASTITMSGAVTTFAAGMGWTNLFTPTGMILPFCEYSKIEYSDYIKAGWKQLAILLVAGLALLSAGTFVTSMF